MHSFLIAAAFVAIVLSPCAAAFWNQSEVAFPKALPFHPGVQPPQDPLAAKHSDMVRCERSSRARAVHKHEVAALSRAALPSAATRH